MGCTQSKIENEEAVSRCKDRKQFMKDAVTTRNAFAAAHSAYSMALKNTGAALSDYSQGEVNELRPSLHHHHHLPHQPTTQPTYETLPPPPPPLPNFSPTPLKRAVTMPEFSIPKPDLKKKQDDTIKEEEDDDDDDEIHEDENDNADHDLTHRRNRRGSGGGGGGGGSSSGRTTEVNTPQPPPSPPTPPKGMTWDYFFPMDIPGPSLSETDEIRPSDDHEESDGGGGYHNHHHHHHSNSTNSRFQGSENVANGNMNGGVGGSSNGNVEEPRTPEKVIEPEEEEEEEEEEEAKPMKLPKAPLAHSNTVPVDNRRGGKPGANVSFLKILNDLDDHFLKASESAHEVSKMLEATRMHYHSNFADNRGHIDHSERVMRVITWNRSFRGIPNTDDGKDDFDSDEHETHATVLDKLLAWEKKLYDEVKAGELMKLEYQRKVALLNKQKKRGVHSEALEKTKAAVSHLHTRYIVDMQSMDSTVSEINRLRDKQLYPKLTALVVGMAQMWDSMHVHHDSQMKIVIDLRSVDVTQTPKETSEQHHERTVQLWGIVQEWHSQFQKLVSHQKEYIQALSNWLKLNLIPIESSLKEKVSSPPRVHQPAIQALLQAWHEHLEQLPDELAGNAIFSFAGIIKTIKVHQEEEMKLKEKCEETRKEFMRKNRAYEDWYHKYMQRRTPPDDMDPERSEDPNHKDPVAERQFLVETLKKRLDEEVEDHQKHCRQVREKSLANLKTHLPELFRAMSDFALACSQMYKNLQSISVSQNSNGTPA